MMVYSYFTSALLRWFQENGRDLPWRETTDPYAIWLSEVILQQTRIQQGYAYWERFMQRFPTVEVLAAATEDEVLRLWQGLGYYSRARNLHTAASQIVALGRFPDTFETIRKLKGVEITQLVEGNGVFAIVPKELIPKLQNEYFFYTWDDERGEVRWMTSFDTTEEDILNFAKLLRNLLNE